MSENKKSRRKFLKTGLAVSAAYCTTANPLSAEPKKPGEVRVLFLAGDYWHNGMMYERHWRRILGVTGWRLMFAQSSDFITPEVIDQTDLLVFSRYGGGNPGFTTDGLVGQRPRGDSWMTSEQEDAIVENVTKRGMGIIPFHCSIANTSNKKVMELMGVRDMIMHGPMVNTYFYEMNQDHPITRGVRPFEEVDEIFGMVMLDDNYTPLYRARQDYDIVRKMSGESHECFYGVEGAIPLDRMAGWMREVGNGRIVYLNCMSYQQVFWKKSMKEIMWRSAHWAMKKDIPESGLIEGRSTDRV